MASERYKSVQRYALVGLCLAVIALYFLGVGIARYLGATLQPEIVLGGGLWVVLLLLGGASLDEFFLALPAEPGFSARGKPRGPAVFNLSRTGWAAVKTGFFLTWVASLSVLLISSGSWTPGVVVFVLLAIAGGLSYSVPPFQLRKRGYGEVILAILVVNVVPAFGFLLVFGELHRFVAMATLPLTGLFLALLIVLELIEYGNALGREEKNLVTRLGWETAMTLHNLAILFSFFVLAIAAVFGLPLFAWLPTLVLILLGGLQIWMMNRVALGAPPQWNALVTIALSLFGAAIYLMGFGFWIN